MTQPLAPRGRAEFLDWVDASGLVITEAMREAIEVVQRDRFVPAYWGDPYGRGSIPIDCGETMLDPEQAIRLFAATEPEPHHRVLEVGTGSGYLTALLAKSVLHVTSLERYRRLLKSAEAVLQRSSITNVSLFVADGSEGYQDGAPYDRIVVHSAFPAVPRLFVDQLVAQGALICAIGPGDGEQMLVRMQKVGSRFERQNLWPVRYQPIAFGTAEVL
ncbi:MAG: methyltransferase domain-containing protein [Fulvimarina manganoxydans]|uniref:methyltransferase domain-containing protein n=1 Tax=Fulvimarina manganoxydans TaxID=937218 RepID=UPI0023529620|nr:methyltransferase domain-containing protein [Fulvimarina manganoxydans]MCK5933148.1 methyltransferase domain-containing protein [Fulvimarina manganoxydans]